MRQQCLMLGVGFKPAKRQFATLVSVPESETDWTTLDNNPDCHPDVLFDLDEMEKGLRLPFDAETFDEVHSYSNFEHYGRQGDWRGFFTGMRELWRVLKPGGIFIGGSPAYHDIWAWGDPGHTRVITEGTFQYLTKAFYEGLGITTSSDYRRYVDPCWWELVHSQIVEVPNGGIWPPCFAYFWGLQKVAL